MHILVQVSLLDPLSVDFQVKNTAQLIVAPTSLHDS